MFSGHLLDNGFGILGVNTMRASVVLIIVVTIYIVYQRFFHPLSTFPGPFLASLTDLWQVYQYFTGQQPYNLTDLHVKYGPIVRYGPNKLSVTSEDAIRTIYVKNSKTMLKTEYYNPFGVPNRPNLFNIRDAEKHLPRRRHLLKLFSPQAVETYEPVLDKNILQLRSKIRDFAHATPPRPFDLKDLFWRFMCDIITDLMYGESWDLLAKSESHGPTDIHALSVWGSVSGAWSAGGPIINLLIALVPLPWAYRVFWQNIGYAMNREKKVKARAVEVKDGIDAERKDILTRLIVEKESKTSEQTGDTDIAIECYGFLIAGVHPPATTMTLLFYHLLHNPTSLHEATAEVRKLAAPSKSQVVFSGSTIEQNLPYLQNCLKENFRVTPVFTMSLPRVVTQDEGVVIGGHRIPKGTTVAVCNHAFHHDPRLWPGDHQTFDPSRWENPSPRLTELSKLMMHFGAGTRQCIGKVLATTIIEKVAATLLSEFQFQLADEIEQQKAEKGVFQGQIPRMGGVGISELEGPLLVRARLVDDGNNLQ